MKLAGKAALVTGGTDGIGKAIAARLRDKGAIVIVSGRDAGRLAIARAEGFEAIGADLSSPGGVEALLAGVEGRPLAILIHNAGMGASYKVDAPIDLEQVERSLFLNLHAPILLIARLLPGLRERSEAMIVNVTSGLAIAPRAGAPV